MSQFLIKKNRTEVLDCLIIEIRQLLNQLCTNPEELHNTAEKLILSRCLDELIVEAMKRHQFQRNI